MYLHHIHLLKPTSYSLKTKKQRKIDFYEVPLPDGFEKRIFENTTIYEKHIEGAQEWYLHRDNGDENAYSVTIEELENVT